MPAPAQPCDCPHLTPVTDYRLFYTESWPKIEANLDEDLVFEDQ